MSGLHWGPPLLRTLNRAVALLLVLGAVWCGVPMWLGCPSRFGRERWTDEGAKHSPDGRFCMADEVLERLAARPGMDADELAGLLGEPSWKSENGRILVYRIGRKPLGPIRGGEFFLRVHLDEEQRLARAGKHSS